jgi:predicted phosphodiesterase
MPTKIQYVSDIHLETYSNKTPAIFEKILKPSAPILALCGDIGYPGTLLYEPFLEYCSNQFEHVFYVAGNHEYYNKSEMIRTKQIETVHERQSKIRAVCSQFPNIHFLDREVYQLAEYNLTIIGCTLWSKLNMPQHRLLDFNDFYTIYVESNTKLSPLMYDEWNKDHVEFLQQAINKQDPASNIIVLTHHCPTYDIIIDKYKKDPYNMNSFFANRDLVLQFGKNVKAWLCGHTHGCKVINVNDILVATNTFGYNSEYIEGFKVDAVIVLP